VIAHELGHAKAYWNRKGDIESFFASLKDVSYPISPPDLSDIRSKYSAFMRDSVVYIQEGVSLSNAGTRDFMDAEAGVRRTFPFWRWERGSAWFTTGTAPWTQVWTDEWEYR
jgi:hypothetical protein